MGSSTAESFSVQDNLNVDIKAESECKVASRPRSFNSLNSDSSVSPLFPSTRSASEFLH